MTSREVNELVSTNIQQKIIVRESKIRRVTEEPHLGPDEFSSLLVQHEKDELNQYCAFKSAVTLLGEHFSDMKKELDDRFKDSHNKFEVFRTGYLRNLSKLEKRLSECDSSIESVRKTMKEIDYIPQDIDNLSKRIISCIDNIDILSGKFSGLETKWEEQLKGIEDNIRIIHCTLERSPLSINESTDMEDENQMEDIKNSIKRSEKLAEKEKEHNRAQFMHISDRLSQLSIIIANEKMASRTWIRTLYLMFISVFIVVLIMVLFNFPAHQGNFDPPH